MSLIKVLYLEDSEESMEAFEDYFENKLDFDFTDNIIAFDRYLYDEDESYDFIIIDFALDMRLTSVENIRGHIPELRNENIPTTVRENSIPLIGYDYLKYAMQHREKTIKMISEKRIVAISGHAALIRKEGLFTEEVFKGVPLFDRAKSSIADIEMAIRNANIGYR